MCGAQLATMLGCWAASGDLHSNTACAEATQALFQCMRTTVRFKLRHYPSYIDLLLSSLCQRKCTSPLSTTIWPDSEKISNRLLPSPLLPSPWVPPRVILNQARSLSKAVVQACDAFAVCSKPMWRQQRYLYSRYS